MTWFHIYGGEAKPQFSINLVHLVSVTREDENSWEATMANQETFTLEGDDLARFRQATGL